MIYQYFDVMADIDGNTEQLYGSYVRADCVYEIEAEKASWRGEGYRNIRIVKRATSDAPSRSVYPHLADAI